MLNIILLLAVLLWWISGIEKFSFQMKACFWMYKFRFQSCFTSTRSNSSLTKQNEAWRKVKHQEVSETDDWNTKKTQYQEITEALVQFFIAQAAVYVYIIQKLTEEQKPATCTSACLSMLKSIETQYIDSHVKKLLIEEFSVKKLFTEEFYIETLKSVEIKHLILLSLSCIQLISLSSVLKPMLLLYIRSCMKSVLLSEIEFSDCLSNHSQQNHYFLSSFSLLFMLQFYIDQPFKVYISQHAEVYASSILSHV